MLQISRVIFWTAKRENAEAFYFLDNMNDIRTFLGYDKESCLQVLQLVILRKHLALTESFIYLSMKNLICIPSNTARDRKILAGFVCNVRSVNNKRGIRLVSTGTGMNLENTGNWGGGQGKRVAGNT